MLDWSTNQARPLVRSGWPGCSTGGKAAPVASVLSCFLPSGGWSAKGEKALRWKRSDW